MFVVDLKIKFIVKLLMTIFKPVRSSHYIYKSKSLIFNNFIFDSVFGQRADFFLQLITYKTTV